MEIYGKNLAHISHIVKRDLEYTGLMKFYVSKGLKVFEEKRVCEVSKELKQLHGLEVLKLTHTENITEEEKAAALKHTMFLKEKRNVTIKGQGITDVCKQHK